MVSTTGARAPCSTDGAAWIVSTGSTTGRRGLDRLDDAARSAGAGGAVEGGGDDGVAAGVGVVTVGGEERGGVDGAARALEGDVVETMVAPVAAAARRSAALAYAVACTALDSPHAPYRASPTRPSFITFQ